MKKKPGGDEASGRKLPVKRNNSPKTTLSEPFSQPISFRFTTDLARQGFGVSFKLWVQSDDCPATGEVAARNLYEIKDFQDGIELYRERCKKELDKDPDSIRGWKLARASLRSLHGATAFRVWEFFQEQGFDCSIEDFLSCCDFNLKDFEDLLLAREEVEGPQEASKAVNEALEPLLEHRESAPSLRRMTREEFWEQSERLHQQQQQKESQP
jgi:hypothetical protein